MSKITSIFLFNLMSVLSATYLTAHKSHLNLRLEHNNKLNKGVWVRPKTSTPDENFGEAKVLFDHFDQNYSIDNPLIVNYVQRHKRSIKGSEQKSQGMEKMQNPTINDRILAETSYKDQLNSLLSSFKLIAVNTKNQNNLILEKSKNVTYKPNATDAVEGVYNTIPVTKLSVVPLATNKNNSNYAQYSKSRMVFSILTNSTRPANHTRHNVLNEKETNEILELFEEASAITKSDDKRFTENEHVWHQNANVRVPDITLYKVQQDPAKHQKQSADRGLIKLLTLLSKTFKKILKHHHDVKTIYNKVLTINEVLNSNVAQIMNKLREFDSKYVYLVKLIDKVKDLEHTQEEKFRRKETELENGLSLFGSQQKKFLAQQKQFYAIQKMMLEQNEKMNLKQNTIAKTQAEITLRQNNFVKILNRLQQLYKDKKSTSSPKLNFNIMRQKETTPKPKSQNPVPKVIPLGRQIDQEAGSVKINLFSLPKNSVPYQNSDQQILSEKDYNPVDDLIYKYYFNNTYIDDLIKSKIFQNTASDSNMRNTKTKREGSRKKSTFLLPINDAILKKDENNPGRISKLLDTHPRKRRWIHHSLRSRKNKKRTLLNDGENFFESNKLYPQSHKLTTRTQDSVTQKQQNLQKNEAFYKMARSFCKEISRDNNDQVLGWCIEKALRRLQVIGIESQRLSQASVKTKSQPSVLKTIEKQSMLKTMDTGPRFLVSSQKKSAMDRRRTENEGTTEAPLTTPLLQVTQLSNNDLMSTNYFFPDNEELETNLKQYELTPDTEGNVYYEGSQHASDFFSDDSGGLGGLSELVPGFDSNSHMDIDLDALDLKNKREIYISNLNSILKSMKQHP